jgi:hypothetical protein
MFDKSTQRRSLLLLSRIRTCRVLRLCLLHLPSLSLHQVTSNHAQVLRRCLHQISRLGTLLQRLQEPCNLILVVQMRACPHVAQMRQSTQPAVLHSRNLQSTPAHRVLFATACAVVHWRKHPHRHVLHVGVPVVGGRTCWDFGPGEFACWGLVSMLALGRARPFLPRTVGRLISTSDSSSSVTSAS